MSALSTMVGLRRLLAGFAAITKDEFGQVVKSVLRTDDGYVDGCWGHFADNPMGYCLSRSPASQGEALIGLALKKAGVTESPAETRATALEEVGSEFLLAVQRDQGCSARISGAKCHECPERLDRVVAKAKSLGVR